MNVYTGFLLFSFSILALTNSVSQTKLKRKHRRNYLSLEAVTDDVNKEIRDTKLDNIRRNVAATVKDGKKNSQLVVTEPEVETFTDFLEEIVDILNTYEVRAFQNFFDILDTEIRTYHYDGCKFSELMQNRYTRSLLAAILKSIRENSVIFTKANINEIADMMRNKMYDESVNELLQYINSLYINTEGDFKRILYNLKLHTKIKSTETYNDLEQVIRDGVRTILFDHYTKLNKQIRRELKEKIETFWEKFKKSSASNVKMNSFFETDPVDTIVKTIENKIKEYEQSISERNSLLDNRKRIVGNDTFGEKFQDNEMKTTNHHHHRQPANHQPTIESGELATNFSDEGTSTEESEDTTVNTKSPIKTKPVLQPQEEIKAVKRNSNTLSRYSKTTESSHRIEPIEFRSRVTDVPEQDVKNVSKHNTEGLKYFNEYVSKKINTIENELSKLKQINFLRTRLINANTDEVKNITDRIEISREGKKKKFLRTNVIELLQNYYDMNNEEFNNETKLNNTTKTELTRKSNIRSRANDENDAININNDTSQVIRKNVDTTTIDTEELKKTVQSNMTTINSTVDSTKTVEKVVTDPIIEYTNKNDDDPNGIIRHKSPLEFIGQLRY